MIINFKKKRLPNTEYMLVRKKSDNSIVGNTLYPVMSTVEAYLRGLGKDPVGKYGKHFGTTNKRGYFEGIKIDKLEIV